jgi:enoyl-CoA hydratase
MSEERKEESRPFEEPVLVDQRDSILILTLNRPERLNAVNILMYERLLVELELANDNPEIRSIVITGQGRAFCVGADLKGHADGPPTGKDRTHYVRMAQKVNYAIQSGSKPIIAAVNGHAIGAGLEIALSADFMIVAEAAKLRFPEIALGTFIGGGITYTLAERVGTVRARELIYLGDFFTGAKAAKIGMAYRSEVREEVVGASLELANRLAEKAPISLAHAKRLMGIAGTTSRQEALDQEAEALEKIFGTRDWTEGVTAFNERRSPNFIGK